MSSTPAARPFGTDRLAVRQALADGTIAVLALTASVALLAHGGTDALGPRAPASAPGVGSPGLDLTGLVLVAASTLPVAAWRRAPRGVFAGTVVASVVLVGLGYPLDLMVGPAAALYLLAASRCDPLSRSSLLVAVVGAVVVAVLATTGGDRRLAGIGSLHTPLAWALAWLAGERARLRRVEMAELSQRARSAERQAEAERRLAVADERARIARDLHDSAGHAVSVIAVHAGAARLAWPRDPERALAATETIEDLARRTAAEIDGIVGALRECAGGDDVEPPPGLGSLDDLVERHRTAGLEVVLRRAGTARAVAEAVGQAVYRIAQEALTNAARHGTGEAMVEVTFGVDALELVVTNPVGDRAAVRSRGGHGLVGMRERVALVGGDLRAGESGDRFRVHALVPYEGRRW